MALLRSSKCRNQNKWITKYILEHAESKESPFQAQTAKVVKHVAGPLIDGSIIKEVSDHNVYIKALFTAEALQEQESEDDSQIDWNKAVIIIRKCSLIFRFHQILLLMAAVSGMKDKDISKISLSRALLFWCYTFDEWNQCISVKIDTEYCEFMLKVNEFQIWDLQHGFELKSKVKFCMENQLVCDKAKLKWKEIEDKSSATSWVDEASKKTFAENANLKQLKADFKINEFIISKDQEKVLDDIAEWKKDFIPSQNSISSNLDPFLPGSSDSLSAIPSGQPNQSNRQQNPNGLISSTCDNSDIQQSAGPDKDITDRDQLNSCRVNSEVADFSKSVVCGMKNKDFRSTGLDTNDNFTVTSSDEFATSTQEFVPNLTDSEARLSDSPFVTQEFQPQLTQGSLSSGCTDTTGTQQFIPQGNSSGNFSPNLSRESNNLSLSSETSPVLIASSGETSQKRTESRKTSIECVNESGSTKSSGDLVFSMQRPTLHSSSPEPKSSESPRLLEMSKSAKKTFQDYFEMSLENYRLNSMAKKSSSISKKRINSDSDSTDDEITRKKQKMIEPSDNNESKRNREKKGFISNVVNRLWQYMGSSTDLQSSHKSDDKDKNQLVNEERKDNSQSGSCEQQKEVQEKNSSPKKKTFIDRKRVINATESYPSNARVTRNSPMSSSYDQGTKSSVMTTSKKDNKCTPSGKVILSSEGSEPSGGVMSSSEGTSQRNEDSKPSGGVMPSDEETSQRDESRERSDEVILSGEKTSQKGADSGMLPSVERLSPEKRNQPFFHRPLLRKDSLRQKSKNSSQDSPSQEESSNRSENCKPDENSPFRSRHPEIEKNNITKSVTQLKEMDRKGKKCQPLKTGHVGEDIKECSVDSSSPKTRSKRQVKQISELSDEGDEEQLQSEVSSVSRTIQSNKRSNKLSIHSMKRQDQKGNLERNRKESQGNHEEEKEDQEEDQQEDVIIISSNEVVHSEEECASPSSKKSQSKTKSVFMLPEYPLPTTETGKRLMNLKFPSQLFDDILNICSS